MGFVDLSGSINFIEFENFLVVIFLSSLILPSGTPFTYIQLASISLGSVSMDSTNHGLTVRLWLVESADAESVEMEGQS